MYRSERNRLAVLFLGALLAVGCESRGTDEAGRFAPPPAPLQADTVVDFAFLKEKVLTPYCLSCHSEFETEEGVRFYVTPGDPANSPLYADMVNGSMPPDGPAAADSVLQIVNKYIKTLSE